MYKKIFILCLLFVLGISLFFFFNKKEEVIIEENPIQKREEKQEVIGFDIKGAVQNPGVYEIEKGKRVLDAIEKSGGLTEMADTQFINLSKMLTNEMVIIIYTKEEIASMTEGNTTIRYVDKKCVCPTVTNDACLSKNKETNQKKEEETLENVGTININTDPKERLLLLPGIGEAKANLIITYREKTPFTKIEDIKNIKGIGEAIFEKLAPYITV